MPPCLRARKQERRDETAVDQEGESTRSGGSSDGYGIKVPKGYPTKNSLKGWYQEHEQDRDLRAGNVRSRQKYSAQQKQIAVQHYLDHDRCIASTMKALGYPCREKGVRASAWLSQYLRLISSHSRLAKKLSAIALP